MSLAAAAATRGSAFLGSSLGRHAVPSTASAAAGPSGGRPLVFTVESSRVCDLTHKRANNGYQVSFSHRRTKTLQQANLQYKR